MTETEWLAATDPKPMLELLQGKASERKLRLFAVACCRRIWRWIKEDASRKAVEVAELFADERVNAEELKASLDDASDAAFLPYDRTPETCPPVGGWYAARAALGWHEEDAGWHNALCTAWAAGAAAATGDTPWDDPAWDRRMYAAWVRHNQDFADRWDDFFWQAPFELGWDAFTDMPGWVAERRQQASLLCDIVGNPFRPVAVDPAWLTWNDGTVRKLAQHIYDDRKFDLLPILCDALEEAGCTDEAVIKHCRLVKEHVRGCWVIDLLLNKQ